MCFAASEEQDEHPAEHEKHQQRLPPTLIESRSYGDGDTRLRREQFKRLAEAFLWTNGSGQAIFDAVLARGSHMKTALAVICLSILAAACGDQSQPPGAVQMPTIDLTRPISLQEEQALIWSAVRERFLSQSCHSEQVTRGSNTTQQDADGARQMSAWLEQTLRAPEYTLVEERATGRPPNGGERYWSQGVRRTYRYEDGSINFTLGTDSGQGHYFHGGYGEQDTLWAAVSSCVALPTGVTILDTTFDEEGKNASVTYTVQWRLNKFGQALNGSGLGSVAAPTERESQAHLRRLDAVGWRVEGL